MERPDDLELVRLVLARQRRQGVPFERAWQQALDALPPPERPVDVADRGCTLGALAATCEDWRRSFEGEPPRDPPGRLAAKRGRELLAQSRRAVAA